VIFVSNVVYFVKNHLQNSKDYVRRIQDEDLDDDGDMIQLSSGNGETSCDQPKVWLCCNDSLCIVLG